MCAKFLKVLMSWLHQLLAFCGRPQQQSQGRQSMLCAIPKSAVASYFFLPLEASLIMHALSCKERNFLFLHAVAMLVLSVASKHK